MSLRGLVEKVFIPNFARNLFSVTHCDAHSSLHGLHASKALQNIGKHTVTLPHVSDDRKSRLHLTETFKDLHIIRS
jgi:hypothetical protein